MKNMWRTREGVLIPIKDMELSHLINAIRYLERTAKDRYKMPAQAVFSQYNNLTKEYEKRMKQEWPVSVVIDVGENKNTKPVEHQPTRGIDLDLE